MKSEECGVPEFKVTPWCTHTLSRSMERSEGGKLGVKIYSSSSSGGLRDGVGC